TESVDGAHSTSTIRSGSASSEAALVQVLRCTDTPPPRVTKPRISSPGTGVQHFASLTQTSEAPLTTTPGSPAGRRLPARAGTALSDPPSEATTFCTTEVALTCPSPTAA